MPKRARRGHVGHELWRRAGELGFLCVDIPEEWGGTGGDFRLERKWRKQPDGIHDHPADATHWHEVRGIDLNEGVDAETRAALNRAFAGED